MTMQYPTWYILRRSHRLAAVSFGMLALFGLSCDEKLPTFQDPREVFSAELSGWYAVTSGDSLASFDIKLTNKYYDTLEDSISIDGAITVTLVREQSYKRTIPLGPGNLFLYQSYDPATRVLGVDAGESVTLRVRWNFRDDLGRSLRDEMFSFHPDPECQWRWVAEPETFLVEGNVRLFRRTSVSFAKPVLFSVCYAGVFVDIKGCPPITSPNSACR